MILWLSQEFLKQQIQSTSGTGGMRCHRHCLQIVQLPDTQLRCHLSTSLLTRCQTFCRNQMMTNELSVELAYSQRMVKPLLQTLQKLVAQLESTPAEETAAARQILACIRLALRVFFSLNSPGLTEVGIWLTQVGGTCWKWVVLVTLARQ